MIALGSTTAGDVYKQWPYDYNTTTTNSGLFEIRISSSSTSTTFYPSGGSNEDPYLREFRRALNQPKRHHPLPTAPRLRMRDARPALPVRTTERIIRVQHRAAQ